MHYPWKWTAVRLLGLKAGDRVLDVCGGTADLALLAAKADRARRPGGGLRHQPGHDGGGPPQGGPTPAWPPASRFLQGDAEHLSCPDASFDAAMVGFGIRNLTHPGDWALRRCTGS